MSIQSEMASVATFLKAVLPSTAQVKYDVPAQPTKDNVVVRMLTTDAESETGYHYRVDRTYQIVIYGADQSTLLGKVDAVLSECMDGTAMIPLSSADSRYIRVKTFSCGAPFKTESGLYAAVGVMPTEIRVARTQEQYDKIMHVYNRYEVRVEV